MKQILTGLFLFIALSGYGQTFSFECYGGYLTGADCQICTGQTTARLFNGLIVRRGADVFKLIDCPYFIRQQGSNLVITELIPNPETVTINLLSSGYSTITGFRDSVACMCARQDSSWIGGGGGGTDLSYSGSSSPVTLNSSTGTDVTTTAGTGISLSATSTNLTITNTAPDQVVSITGAGINVVTGIYPNFTVTGTEVDGSVSNEGVLGVGAGGGNDALVTSNTSGAIGVTISGSNTVLITETTSANGGTVTIKGDTSLLATVNDVNEVSCRWCSVKRAMPYYSNNPNTAFEALRTYWASRMGEIVVDTTVTLTANTAVAAAIRFVGGGNINISTGNTITFSGAVSADPKHHIFTGAGTYAFDQKSTHDLWPYWFGALGNGSADDTDEIQKCVDAAISSNISVVRFLTGNHIISKGILVRNGSNTVTLQIEGNAGYDINPGTTITCTHNDNFAIGIQGARRVELRNLYLRGPGNSYNPTITQVITNTISEWATQYGRNDRYSPFAGICIDPFKTTAPSGGGYPGFSAQYSNSHALSSAILVDNVTVRYFIVGSVISPNGSGGNGSEIVYRNSIFNRCQYGIATGHGQNRSVDVIACAITTVAACLDGLTFGQQLCPMPNVIGGQMGFCKDMFRFPALYGDGKITSIYGESIYRLGTWLGNSGAPLSFVNCELKFATDAETSKPDAASVLDAPNCKVIFQGGSLIYSTSRPVEMNVRRLMLRGVNLNRPILNNPNGASNDARISYEGCQIAGYGNQFFSSLVETDVDGLDYQRAIGVFKSPGQRIAYYELGTNSQNAAVYWNDNDAEDHTVLMESSVSVTVDTTARTATFTGTNTGRYRVGDILFAYNNNSTSTPNATSKACSFGIVSSIVGTTITCSSIPSGIVSGTYGMYLWKETIFTGTFVANITSGSNKVVITSKNTHGPSLSAVWPVGTRVYSKSNQSWNSGLYAGLYVSSVTADTLFLSGNVGSTVSGLEIFNGWFRGTYYSEDNTYQTGSSTYRTVGYSTGDEIVFTSHAYRARAIITAGGFTPTVKFIFKPLSGLSASKPTPTSVDAGVTYFSTDTDALEIWDGTAWNAQDASNTNEAWTIDADAGDTELITTQTVLFDGTGGIATSYNAAGNTLTIDGSGIGGSGFYQTFRDDNLDKTQRAAANFISTSTISVNLTDDAGNNETEIQMDVPSSGITATEIAAGAVGTSEIATNAVGNDDFRQSASLSVVGNPTNATANVQDIAAASDGQVLRRSGTAVAFGALSLTNTGTVSGLTANQVLYGGGSGQVAQSSNFTFDGTNAALSSGGLTAQTTGTFNNQNANKAIIGAVAASPQYPGIWFGPAAPSLTNYAFLADVGASQSILNAPSGGNISLRINNSQAARITSTGLAILTTTNSRTLHVNGDVRFVDLITETPNRMVGADADGDLDTIGIGAENELHLTNGTLGTNFHTTISPTSITASQTDYNPTGLATAWIVRLTADDGFRLIRSLVAPAFNKRLTLHNIGSNSILLANQCVFSGVTAAYRFDFGRDVILFPGKSIEIIYDVTSSRWKLLSKAGIFDDVEHLYFNERFNAPVSGTSGDYSFWDIVSENGIGGVAPVAGRMVGVSVNTGANAGGLGYVASKDLFFENTNAAGVANWAYCKALIKTPADLSSSGEDYTIRIGFADATGGGGANDGFYFDYNHANVSGNWGCNTTNASNTQRNNSGVAVTASTNYLLEVFFRPDLTAEYYINGTRVATNDTFVPAGTSDDLLIMAEIQKSAGTAQRTLTVYTLQTSIAFTK